jgi:hypothetical protein
VKIKNISCKFIKIKQKTERQLFWPKTNNKF